MSVPNAITIYYDEKQCMAHILTFNVSDSGAHTVVDSRIVWGAGHFGTMIAQYEKTFGTANVRAYTVTEHRG